MQLLSAQLDRTFASIVFHYYITCANNNKPGTLCLIYIEIILNSHLQIDQAGLGMRSRKFLTSEKYADMRESYIRFGKNVGVLFGADAEMAETDMRKILALDIKLANVSRRFILP